MAKRLKVLSAPLFAVNILVLFFLNIPVSMAQATKDILSSVNSCLSSPSNDQEGAKASCVQSAISAQSPKPAPQLQTTIDQITQLYNNTYLAAVQNQQRSSGPRSTATVQRTPPSPPPQTAPQSVNVPPAAQPPSPTAQPSSSPQSGIKYY